jgi:hypothetical protein
MVALPGHAARFPGVLAEAASHPGWACVIGRMAMWEVFKALYRSHVLSHQCLLWSSITRKTVETHVGHVYRQLDISGRGQLATAL